MNSDKLIQGIRKAKQVVRELVSLALEIGTLVTIIKMVIETITR